jgi:sulfatase modifying factor 1
MEWFGSLPVHSGWAAKKLLLMMQNQYTRCTLTASGWTKLRSLIKNLRRFVRATKYKTVAERQLEAKDFPNSPPENLRPGAMVFSPPKEAVSKTSHWSWWRYVPGANWQHPEGPESSLKGRINHPVVEIAWEDANEYAKWSGKRLPTESEFEYAARGGLDRNKFSWGNEVTPDGKWRANIWQGHFPDQNTVEDGFERTAPVGSFPANSFGLCDITGNVWEWCSDWYRPNYNDETGGVDQNPQGPVDSQDPSEPRILKKVLRGGSFLCTDQYCSRYLVGARGKAEPRAAWSNVGFRCVQNTIP